MLASRYCRRAAKPAASATTVRFSRAFMQEAKLEVPDIVWGDLIVALAGYIMMLAPLALWFIFPYLMAPPLGSLLVGILLLSVGMSLLTQTRLSKRGLF